MVDAIGPGKVRWIARSKPIEGSESQKGKPDREKPSEDLPEQNRQENRVGANIDEQC